MARVLHATLNHASINLGTHEESDQQAIGMISSLIGSGTARTDTLRIGLDVDADCAVIDAEGNASDRIFAIGPLTRGTFFEIDAVPEIREQCCLLAQKMVGQIPSGH